MIDYESEAVKALNFKGHSPERRIMPAGSGALAITRGTIGFNPVAQ